MLPIPPCTYCGKVHPGHNVGGWGTNSGPGTFEDSHCPDQVCREKSHKAWDDARCQYNFDRVMNF